MKNPVILICPLLIFATLLQAQVEGLPANPVPGKCYIRCITPEQYETTERRMLARPSYTTLTKVPAEYQTVEERVLVKAASKHFVTYPAEYRTVVDTIFVEDPYNEVSIVPVKFAVKSETIEVRPKVALWEYQTSVENCESEDPRDCMVLCYVEHPAEYRTVNSQFVENDATFNKVRKGGKYTTVTRQEVVKEARIETIEVPAEYQNITRRVLVKDEEVVKVEVPAEYSVETFQTLTDKGGVVVWEEVDCKLTSNNQLPILYELGSSQLTASSLAIIDTEILKLMKDKPNIRVEISAHTDARGAAAANLALSQARAESVVNYLVGRGIQRTRLVARGYGESKPKNRCADGVNCSEAEHAENRRTEFRVMSN